MRLLIVGTLKGQLTLATKYAMDKGASVMHADTAEQALAVLRSGRGADLLMVDVAIDIYVNNRLVARGEVVLVEDKLGVTMTEIIKADR